MISRVISFFKKTSTLTHQEMLFSLSFDQGVSVHYKYAVS